MTLTGEQVITASGSYSAHTASGAAMLAQWTPEQVLALAPDAASAKNGRGLATARKWAALGTHEA